MAQIYGRGQLQAFVTIQLSEAEAAALDALAGYGQDAFLKVFYKEMGEAYLKPHEMGLRSLFKSLQDGECGVHSVLTRAKDARLVFSGSYAAVKKESPQ